MDAYDDEDENVHDGESLEVLVARAARACRDDRTKAAAPVVRVLVLVDVLDQSSSSSSSCPCTSTPCVLVLVLDPLSSSISASPAPRALARPQRRASTASIASSRSPTNLPLASTLSGFVSRASVRATAGA